MNVILTVSFLLIAVATLGTQSASLQKRNRCNCIQNAPESKCANIRLKIVKKIERLPAGTFCNKEEVIIYFRNGKSLCVDPTSESVKRLEELIQQRAASNVNTISTTSTPETTTTDN